MQYELFANPYKPGAGHMPPFLAGRDDELKNFMNLLDQRTVIENCLVTGLRGVGKSVFLDTLKPRVLDRSWLWVGSNLSESTSINEHVVCERILTDLASVTSNISFEQPTGKVTGFSQSEEYKEVTVTYETLRQLFDSTPGLMIDKLKATLEFVWSLVKETKYLGIVFAYDEAQTMSDHSKKEQYPLALLLDTFQSIQTKGFPYLLVLAGLPTLFPKLVQSRTYSERMFKVMPLDRLRPEESRDAILEPIKRCPIKFLPAAVDLIVAESGGYPYFIQFMCKEFFDIYLQRAKANPDSVGTIFLTDIVRKLDRDFFSPRYEQLTDRQRDLMAIICSLSSADEEFTGQEIVGAAKEAHDEFSSSHVNQLLKAMIQSGFIYRNRHGKYSFAVPLWASFVKRRATDSQHATATS
jgi:hypothetical protein